MRIKLSDTLRTELFRKLKERGFNCHQLSELAGVCERTMRDWKRGKYLISEEAFRVLAAIVNKKPESFQPTYLDDYWHIQGAARKGAQRRAELYGDLGTPEGRRKGGLQSVAAQRNLKTGFRLKKQVSMPMKNEALAEFVGIIAGDGHLARYQVLMVTNSETDGDHAKFVAELGEELFSVKASVRSRSGEKSTLVLFSSKQMVEHLRTLGVPKGKKIDNGLCIPEWVHAKPSFERAFLRGLFDTDGCVFLDKHQIKHKLYAHIGLTITSHAPEFLQDIFTTLRRLGFKPSYKVTQHSVFLRRQQDVKKFFDEIGSDNPKHICRYNNFVTTRRGA